MASGNIKIDAGEMDRLVEIFNGCTDETYNAHMLFNELSGDLKGLYYGKANDQVSGTIEGLMAWIAKMNLMYAALSKFITNTHAQFLNVDSTKGEHAEKTIETEMTTPSK